MNSFNDIGELVTIMPASPASSPVLRGVTTRKSNRGSDLEQVWQDVLEAPMPTAGPLNLEDYPLIPQSPLPVTGAKRPRSPNGTDELSFEFLSDDAREEIFASLEEGEAQYEREVMAAAAVDEIAAAANIPPIQHSPHRPRPRKLSRRPTKRVTGGPN